MIVSQHSTVFSSPVHRLLLPAVFALVALCTGCSDAPEAAPGTASPAATTATTRTLSPDSATEPASTDSPTIAQAAAATPAAAKPSAATRTPIYMEAANGEELIAAALKRAQRDHKHVLIEWGGNWCGWCWKLHDVFHNESTVQPLVHEEFELVLIDQGKNNELMLKYAGEAGVSGFPHLTVLDSAGAVLTNQETGSLEVGPQHDPQRVAAFLQKWMPAKQDAEQLLSAALATAASEQKAVLVRVGSPYCGWCTVLSTFMQEHQSVFAVDYVDLKIDTMRMTNGAQVADRLQPEGAEGIPWMVILDASGKILATSIASEGNIGYPYQPQEIAHFIAMLKSTCKRLTDADLEAISADLNAYRVARDTQ
ncbi:MAG: thioredoxin family protein [Planctomyces sp.]